METETVLSETWGTVTYRHDKTNHVCYLRFAGNGTLPPNGQTRLTFPSTMASPIAMLFPLYGGGYMEITGTDFRLKTVGVAWQAGSIVYPTI